MKITGFKLLKKGAAGIEVTGIDLVDAGNHRVVFTDGLKRTRKFPLSFEIRKAVNALNYPFLVGTEHWDQSFASYMKDDYSGPDKSLYDPTVSMSKKLNSFWESTQIVECKVEVGRRYKITGEIYCELCTIKTTVVIEEASDSSLHSFVDETVASIMKLVEQTLALPQLALSNPTQVRELFKEISTDDEQERLENLSEDDQFIAMMTQARKKGFGIVLDDNSLAQFALTVANEDEPDNEEFRLDKVKEDEGDETKVASMTTKEPSIFKESINEAEPEYVPEEDVELPQEQIGVYTETTEPEEQEEIV